MNNWWQKYLGKPWQAAPGPPESFNCGELVRHIYRERRGIEMVPIEADASDLRQCIEGMDCRPYGLRPLTEGESVRELDVVFMARNKYDDHCGLAVETAEGLMTLHCQQGAGVLLDSVFDLESRGYRRFKWRRHEELI